MTNERMLYLINKAIGNLKDNEDFYGSTPVDFMRKNGIKSTENMSIFLDSVGAYLEELRCGILGDIEADAAKKNGKSSILSAVKKLSKACYNNNIDKRPSMAYASYDEAENKYWMCNGYWLLVSENSEGLNMIPENVKKDIASPMNYKAYLPKFYEMEKLQLPSVGKVTAYLKQAKAKRPKKPTGWDKIVLTKKLAVKGEWLEAFMKITGATEIYFNGLKPLGMEGNGYVVSLCPIQVKDEDTITNFEEI